MLVTFSTEAYADIIMFGDVAINLLKMMGHSGTVPSAILAEDIPQALQRLTTAIEAANISEPLQDIDKDEPEVSIGNRAIPLLNLLAAAAKAKANVMWK